MVPSSFFILASSVCKSLQCLISALTQGGECGHLFRLTCSVVLWGGRNTANKYHWRVWEMLACLDHTGFSPAHGTCAFPVYTAQAPGCSAGELSKAGSGFLALPRSKLLRFRFSGTPQRQTWLGMRFLPFQCPSSSGDQLLGERTVPGGLCILITFPVPAAQFPGCARKTPSLMCCVSPLGS